MVKAGLGLTATYNLLREQPDTRRHRQLKELIGPSELPRLRLLHEQLDRAVLAAYGWSDVEPVPYGAASTNTERTQLAQFEDEVIQRLFALNARRAVAEQGAAK